MRTGRPAVDTGGPTGCGMSAAGAPSVAGTVGGDVTVPAGGVTGIVGGAPELDGNGIGEYVAPGVNPPPRPCGSPGRYECCGGTAGVRG